MKGQAGGLEDGTPQRGPAAELGGGLEAKSSETVCRPRKSAKYRGIFFSILVCYCQSIDQQNIFGRRRGGHAPMSPSGYAAAPVIDYNGATGPKHPSISSGTLTLYSLTGHRRSFRKRVVACSLDYRT